MIKTPSSADDSHEVRGLDIFLEQMMQQDHLRVVRVGERIANIAFDSDGWEAIAAHSLHAHAAHEFKRISPSSAHAAQYGRFKHIIDFEDLAGHMPLRPVTPDHIEKSDLPYNSPQWRLGEVLKDAVGLSVRGEDGDRGWGERTGSSGGENRQTVTRPGSRLR